MSRPPPPRG